MTIFAAASLTTAISSIRDEFERQHPETALRLNFAASSILAKQIADGAPADIFLSANSQWMDFLEEKGLLVEHSRRDLLSNRLVVIVAQNSGGRINDIRELATPAVKRLAIADWTHVPAGMYAKEVLVGCDLWQKIQSKCLPGLDARATVAYVEGKNADYGLVYLSDAKVSSGVEIAYLLPDSLQPDITYPMAVVNRRNFDSARLFLDFLESSMARQIFIENGFSTN